MAGRLILARHRCAAAMALAIILSGCSKQESSTASASPPDPVGSAPVPAAVNKSQHVVVGKAPITNSGIPAIIILEPRHSRPLPEPSGVPALDQWSRTFVPPVLFVRAGHRTEFRNSDPEMHNINVKDLSTRDQAFNVALPPDERYMHAFERAGVYDVSCDVHPGMSAQIVATTTPYATLTDKEGNFIFPDVVPGTYAVTVYAGEQTIQQTIEVAGARTDVDVTHQ